MDRYNKFDAEQFLKDAVFWSKQIDDLQLQLEAVTEIGGASDNPGHSGEISKPVEMTAVRREQIQMEIDRIREYQSAFLYAWYQVTDYDRELIAGFFIARGSIYKFVDSWCAKHASNRQYCYRDRRLAVEHFGNYVVEWMSR